MVDEPPSVPMNESPHNEPPQQAIAMRTMRESGRVADHGSEVVAGMKGLLDEPASGTAAGAEDGEPHHVFQVRELSR
jgi:hypothetical protein